MIQKFNPKKISLLIALIFVITGCSLLASSCSATFHYDNADKYSAGGGAIIEKISSIDVDWISGNIDFDFNGDPIKGIVFSEESNKELDEIHSMYHWLDGTTLRIKFAASGKSNFNGINKKLSVTIPSDVTLSNLKINSISANISLDEARSDEINVETVSGNLSINNIRPTESIRIASTSGNVSGSLITPCKKVDLSSTTGSISFLTEAKVRDLKVETVSGNVSLLNHNPAKSASVETVSGNVKLEFLDNSGFDIAFDTVRGDLVSDFKLYTDGTKYIFGVPQSSFNVKTVAGDLILKSLPT